MQKIPIFYSEYYTAIISPIAVADRRYCQEDPYYSVSSVNSWQTRWHLFTRRSLYFIMLPPINRWRARCVDQQQQQQQQQKQQQQQQQHSVASAILAATQQRVRNDNHTYLIFPHSPEDGKKKTTTPTFRSSSTFRLCGYIYMELVWDIYYAVLKGRWMVDRGPIGLYTERLFGAAMKTTDKTLCLVLRFLRATPLVVFFFCFFLFYGLACFGVFSYPVR